MNRVIIAGSRTFKDYDLLSQKMDFYLRNMNHNEIEIVSGGAFGADLLGERYASENSYSVKRFLPDWEKHGKSAGMIRNHEMAKYADYLVAFWDGKSRGTANMIETAKKLKLEVRVVEY